MHNAGKNPVWSKWACPITTASSSSNVISNESSRGYESIGERAPGLIPQSTKILLSGVDNSIEDLPTCPKPPRVWRDTSVLCDKRGLKISSPTCFICLLLSVEACFRVELIVWIVLDGIVVAFLILNLHPIFSVKSAWLNSLAFLCNSQGLFASIDTSPVEVSNSVDCKLVSSGTCSAIIFLHSSSGFLIDSSVRITIRFLIILTSFEIVSLFSKRYLGEFV